MTRRPAHLNTNRRDVIPRAAKIPAAVLMGLSMAVAAEATIVKVCPMSSPETIANPSFCGDRVTLWTEPCECDGLFFWQTCNGPATGGCYTDANDPACCFGPCWIEKVLYICDQQPWEPPDPVCPVSGGPPAAPQTFSNRCL